MNACAELFTKTLDSKNLRYSASEGSNGETIVDFPYQGKVFKCIFSGNAGTYFSLYLVFEHIPEEKVVDIIFLCNELNTKYKWITFFVDKDKDLMLHDDAILSIENAADEALELLIRSINIGDEIKPLVMKTIYA
jgi:hypothetical protein